MDGIEEFFKQFDWVKLAIILLFALPGFISLKIWALISPTSEKSLKDELGEAVSFGLLNAIVCAPVFVVFAPANSVAIYFLGILTLLILPAVWPIILLWVLRRLENAELILISSRSAWDDVFLREEAFFVIVHLSDGGRVGGYYGRKSFAGLHPISGHIYLEELWYLDDDGKFLKPVPDSKGLILRPTDYKYVELFAVNQEPRNGR